MASCCKAASVPAPGFRCTGTFKQRRIASCDLGQLLIGEVQLGERSAGSLPGDEQECLAAYVAGLRAEGCDVDIATVERGHALGMLLFAALPSLPFDLLEAPPTPAAIEVSRQRAAAARFVLDLVAATA